MSPVMNTAAFGSGNFGYDIRDFRDFNNAAPSVCFGFESMPGHQKEGQRGGYGPGAISGGTFGGCGAYAAQVGGLWDALLGEGRHWWLFASPDYNVASNDTTRVIATFNALNWKTYADGWKMIRCSVHVDRSMYFRLRGANLAPGTPNETDAAGNPLSDTLVGANTAAKAWADLWFYSNPVFVMVR